MVYIYIFIYIYTLEVNHHLKKWWFLLQDDKPLLQKVVVRKPTYKKWWLDFQGLWYTDIHIYKYIYIPGTQMTSIFEGQPPKTRPFPIKTRVSWVPGIYIYIYLFTFNIYRVSFQNASDQQDCFLIENNTGILGLGGKTPMYILGCPWYFVNALFHHFFF